MKLLLAHLASGAQLSVEQTIAAFESIMTGQATAAQIAALLSMLQLRGVTEDEMVGAATVMRRHVTPVALPAGLTVIDTCGTGGTGSHTFNVSTAAGLVAAAVGRPRGMAVAKHGNRSVTSASGSSQVLEALGVNIQARGVTLTRCLDEAGFCFCFAPLHHPAMKHAAPIRADLGFRTIFNLLGPLTNPGGARRQVMGVFTPQLTEPIARVLQRLGSEQAMVVHGRLSAGPAGGGSGQSEGNGLGELTTTGSTRISHLQGGMVRTYELDAASLGLPQARALDLRVDGPEASAAIVRSVLSGQAGPARDIVCLNAAAALVVADLAGDLAKGLTLAASAIDSGAAAAVLERVVEITNS